MRILAVTPGGRDGALARAAREHEVAVVGDARDALELAPGRDVLLVDAAVPGARELAAAVRADPDLLTTAVVTVVDDPAAVPDWTAVADDVLVAAHAEHEVLARVRSAGRLAALRGELHARTLALEELAYSDPLTGLPNRRYLVGRLEALLSSARRHGRQLTVLLADLDRFKEVNDRDGHEAGDRLLVAAADGMRRRLRAEDVVGRWGGDEFLAILPDTGLAAARASAERLRVAVSRQLGERARGIDPGLSIGLACWDGEEEADALVRRVDAALYEAKRSGRGRVALASR